MQTDSILAAKGARLVKPWVGYAVTFFAIIVIIAVSWILYRYTVDLLTDNLRKRELSIVSTAAVQFNVDDLRVLQLEEDFKKPQWAKVVNQLAKIRKNNQDIVFAYILRKDSNNPNKMVFVADADSIDPFAKIDLDGNGVIDDADALVSPGVEYEDLPTEAFLAYDQPTTNKDLYEDQWGVLISGYAPIKDDQGITEAIIAIDIKANDFYKITTQTFLPFLTFILVLIAILLILAWCLITIWNKRVKLVEDIDKQKDELLGIVSHQLATPVSSVNWYLEMMIDGDLGKLTKQQIQHVSEIKAVVNGLSDLVSMILDVSRIQLGRMKIDKQNLDLNLFFEEILSIVAPKASIKNINFVINIPKKLPEAELDKRYTRMTIENLLTNAIKYTPNNGKVDFKVNIKDGTIYCSIADTGCGIPEGDKNKIFQKLYRATNVRNTVDGNGFGLYVAKGAIEAQGGKISFESEENKGTTFYVELPIY